MRCGSNDRPTTTSARRAEQAQLTERIREIAATRVRYGYRRIHVLLRREGWLVNPKRVYRLYREMGLQLRHKTPKRRVKAKLREDRRPATRSNETWAMDFVHDQLATGYSGEPSDLVPQSRRNSCIRCKLDASVTIRLLIPTPLQRVSPI